MCSFCSRLLHSHCPLDFAQPNGVQGIQGWAQLQKDSLFCLRQECTIQSRLASNLASFCLLLEGWFANVFMYCQGLAVTVGYSGLLAGPSH